MSLVEIFREGLSDDKLRQHGALIENKIDAGEIDPSKMSIREVYEATIGPDLPMHRLMNCANGMEYRLFQEDVGPVRSSAFTNIMGKILLDGVMAGFTYEPMIGDSLFEVFTDRDDGGRWGAIEDMADEAMEVKEGEEFPSTKVSEDYVDTPHSKKRGLKIGVTKEMLHFDKTGQVRRVAMQVGQRVAINRENRMLRTFIGYINPYNRKSAGYALTYQSSGDRTNSLTGKELVDWTDLDEVYQAFADYKGYNGEPIEVTPKQLVVMPAKSATARRILEATQVRHTTASSIETLSSTPVNTNLEVLSSSRLYQLIQQGWVDSDFEGTTHAAVSAADAGKWWFVGDFKKTFKYRTIFPLQTITAGPEHPDNFGRDVILQARASERGVPFVVDPWNAMRITG